MRSMWAGALAMAGCGSVLGGGKERAAECADRIDNDRDLLWDADDPDCLGVPDAAVPGDGSVTDPEGGGGGGTTLPTSQCDGPPQITDLTVECEPTGQAVVLTVELGASAGTVELFMMDTANFAPWSESHPLEVLASGPCSETWRVALVTSDGLTPTLDNYQSGESSLFTCTDFFDRPGILTYAAWAKNGGGSDCVTTGHDPDGLAAGDYDADMVNEPSFNLGRCEVLQ